MNTVPTIEELLAAAYTQAVDSHSHLAETLAGCADTLLDLARELKPSDPETARGYSSSANELRALAQKHRNEAQQLDSTAQTYHRLAAGAMLPEAARAEMLADIEQQAIDRIGFKFAPDPEFLTRYIIDINCLPRQASLKHGRKQSWLEIPQ